MQAAGRVRSSEQLLGSLGLIISEDIKTITENDRILHFHVLSQTDPQKRLIQKVSQETHTALQLPLCIKFSNNK